MDGAANAMNQGLFGPIAKSVKEWIDLSQAKAIVGKSTGGNIFADFSSISEKSPANISSSLPFPITEDGNTQELVALLARELMKKFMKK